MPSGWTSPRRSAKVPRRRGWRPSISAMCRSTRSTSSSGAITTSSSAGFRLTGASDLDQAQSVDKTVFEFWTHALSYVPTRDFRFFVRAMKKDWQRHGWFGSVTPGDLRKVLARIRENGALTIRDIDDDVLVDKDHPWASRKPSKRALQVAFSPGDGDDQPADRHAEDLRTHRPAFRLGEAAGGGDRSARSSPTGWSAGCARRGWSASIRSAISMRR